MAPFPEAEDMTIKRLYVALKRDDMQLLQMGAHKLHEKYHTGYKFELLDDLRQILSYVEEQTIPNDIKDLLTRTIADILNGNAPYQEETISSVESDNFDTTQDKNSAEIDNSAYNTTPQSKDNEDVSPIDIIYPNTQDISSFQENLQPNETFYTEENKNEEQIQEEPLNILPKEETFEDNLQEEPLNMAPEEEVFENNLQEEIQEELFDTSSNIETQQNEEQKEEEQVPSFDQNEQTSLNFSQEEINNTPILEEKIPTLKNVAVFYDDKSSTIDYMQNKFYRYELDLISLNKEANPLESASYNKKNVDVPTDDIGEILKMLNTIKGDVYFVTTSKSENIIKTFIEHYIDFEIPLVCENTQDKKVTKLIPLFGLSNIFICPKCGNREYFGGIHNKVLTLQCKNCSSSMYPDIYEAENYKTNANPYYWINALSAMACADTWILINPPLENDRKLTMEFLKSAYQISKPKKVYILSKETTRKEYYRQMFNEIYPMCEIKSDFLAQDELCENFINNEMSSLKVNV